MQTNFTFFLQESDMSPPVQSKRLRRLLLRLLMEMPAHLSVEEEDILLRDLSAYASGKGRDEPLQGSPHYRRSRKSTT